MKRNTNICIVNEREKSFLASDDRKTAEEYWKGLLSDAEGEAFPEGDKEDDVPSQGLLHAAFSLDEAEFKGFLKSTGCRKSSFFTGVGAYLMSLYSGNKKTVTESIWHGRDDSLKNIAGMMVRSIPFVCDREAAVSVPDYLKQMEAQLVAGRKYSDLPFIRVAEKYGLKNKVSVAYQGTYSQCIVIEGVDLDVERIYPPSAINSSELIFEISELGGGRYDLQLLYRGDHYSDEFANSIADTYIHLAKEMIKAESFDDISLLSEDEKARLDAVNYNEKEVEKTDIVTLFNRACNDYPGNGAVVYGENRYTYREVKDIADRIAGYTVKLGLGKEDVVSILIPRNEYIAIAPLGHDWGEWQVTKAPQIGKTGERQRICSRCKEKETEAIAALIGYDVISGADGSWTKGSDKAYTITVKRSEDDASCFAHYVETLIDGKKVVVSAKEGSTVVTISAGTLEKLSAGTHTVTVKFDDGQTTTKLTVKNRTASTDSEPSKPTDSNPTKSTGSDSPQTGDNSNIGLWLALMLLSAAAVTALLISSRKKKASS